MGASLTVWLTALRKKLVSPEQAAGAFSRITSSETVKHSLHGHISWLEFLKYLDDYHATLSLPVAGDPCGTPTHLLQEVDMATGVIAVSSHSVLITDNELRWSEQETVHSITPHSLSETKRMFMTRMTRAERVLTELHSIGDSTGAENILRTRTVLHLPRSVSPSIESALEQAAVVRALIAYGMNAAQVMDSRSGDDMRMKILRDLDHSARMYMCAAASSPH